MIFRNRLRYHLVKLLKCSNKQADSYCHNGHIMINGEIVFDPLTVIDKHQEIRYLNNVIRPKVEFLYVLFHKPNLYECTANRQIPNHIYELIPQEYQHLHPIGRLDKNSEGLLLLTNDGPLMASYIEKENLIEKEYLVTTHYPITSQLEKGFTEPFKLGQRTTLPAKFIKLSDFSFKVILTEGINRQIRRICAKHENQVKQLIRIRMGSQMLGDLKSGHCLQKPSFN